MSALINKMLNLVGFDGDDTLMEEEENNNLHNIHNANSLVRLRNT